MFFNDNCKLLRKKMHFTRIVIQKYLFFEADFFKFASEMKKNMYWWLPFRFYGYKEAKNNKFVVTF